MAHSEFYIPAKLGDLPPPFTNDYLLKHGNLFMRPKISSNGFQCAFLPSDIGYPSHNGLIGSSMPTTLTTANGAATPNYDAPLDFVIKHEKPPTPPASTSPVGCKTPPEEKTEQVTVVQLATSAINDQSKWILGKQKLSWDNSVVASYNPETKMFRCVVCNAVGFLSRIAEHYLGTHTSAKVFQCLHCPYSSTWSRCVRMHMAKHHGVPNAPPSLWKGQPLLEEIFLLLTNLKTTVDSQGRERMDPELCDKKFVCPKCPYTTDRRDLYLRHENIHKEDKPYHCYICFKLFNRADHVKKHFLRIHRGHPYDISLVRRRPPRNASSATSNANTNVNGFAQQKPKTDIAAAKTPVVKKTIPNTNDGVGSMKTSAINCKDVKGFECPFCSWEGADAWCLRRHMGIHTRNYNCPNCNFKATKAENLFTHVYKAHKMLICTKCKFVTDQAHYFEEHVKDCCSEIVLGCNKSKTDEDFAPDAAAHGKMLAKVKLEPDDLSCHSDASRNGQSPVPTSNGTDATTLRASVSIMPLHNSISYCFPSHQNGTSSVFKNIQALAGCTENISVNVSEDDLNGNALDSSKSQTKMDCKTDLSSPVQSSSDSGVADIASDQNEIDLTCWHCGCELANESSLNTHIELYHRSQRTSKLSEQQRKKKFACALCNFSSDEQTTILDHMRYHTGEALPCRAGKPCEFSTVSDATLREHVSKEHSDGRPRCPHCGLQCNERVAFIRHYRKFHHSTSCYRCRELRRSFEKPCEQEARQSMIQPYLHHNPYAKSSNTTLPYNHRDSSMPCIAVSIPLQQLSDCSSSLNGDDSSDRYPVGERRSRKQSMPRKLVQQDDDDDNNLDIENKDKNVKKKRKSGPKRNVATNRKNSRKLRKKHCKSFRHSRSSGVKTVAAYRNKTRTLVFSRLVPKDAKLKCRLCGEKFRYSYQRLIHHRKSHNHPNH